MHSVYLSPLYFTSSFGVLARAQDSMSNLLELTINKGQADEYQLGNGYGHFAVSVDNIEAEHKRFEEAGLKPWF